MSGKMRKIISAMLAAAMLLSCMPVLAETEAETITDSAAVSDEAWLAGEEEHRAEKESEQEKVKQKRAEEDKRREEEEAERMAQMEALGLPAPGEHPTRPPEPAKQGELVVMEDGGYSEVVYIKTVEDLLAVDRHRDGYYELQNDIDLAGMEWEPLYLKNATFNGNGHAIKNMTITEKHIKKQITDDWGYSQDYSINALGLLCGEGNYAYDLTMNDVNIDVTISNQYVISAVGAAYSDSCSYDGSINVTGSSGAAVYGVAGGNDCTADVAITAEMEESVPVSINGLYNCVNSVHNGDIKGENISFANMYAILDCTGCENNGDITVVSSQYGGVTAIYNSDNCINNGDITVMSGSNYLAAGISDSDNCINNGDMTVSTYAPYSEIRGIYNSYNCVSNTNMSVLDGWRLRTSGISKSEDCKFYGDIYSVCDLIRGIEESSGCYFEGKLTAEETTIDAIYESDNCYLKGDISMTGHVSGGVYDTVTAIYSSQYSRYDGNITTNLPAYGISYSDNCYMSGNFTNYGECGISYSTSCRLYGNVVGWGISGSTNCQLYGNAEGFGISGSTNCQLYGNVTSDLSSIGLRGCNGCSISGIVTAWSGELTVSEGAPYQVKYKCEYCGAQTIRSQRFSSDAIHCYRYYSNDGEPQPNYYKLEYDLFYSDSTEPGYADPENPTPIPTPTQGPASYTIQVINIEGEKPLADATVTVDGAEYITDSNGVVVLNNAPRTGGLKIEYGGETVHTEPNFRPVPNQMNVVRVSPLNLEKDDLYAGDNGSARMTGPLINLAGYKFPMFDMEFDMNYELFDQMKVAYSAEDKTFQVLIGGENDLAAVEVDASSTSWKETFKEFKAEYESAKNGDYYVPFKENKMPSPGTLGISGSMDTRGYMEITLKDGESMQINGGVVITLSGKAEYVHYFVPGAYAAFSVSGELGADLNWELVNTSAKDPKINFNGKFNAKLTPGAGVGAGIRKLIAGEIGLRGSLGVEYKFPGKKIEEALEAKLTASFYGAVFVLGHPFEHSKDLASLEIYPDFGYTEVLSIDTPDTYTINREYLSDLSLMSEDGMTINGNVYPYSNVRTESLGDGRVIMVWLDDDTSRSSMDRTALYYSILENGVWSAPEQIDNDGTADFDFDLKAYGSRAAVVWQNTNSHLDDDASIEDTAAAVELSYAEFDGSTWSAPVNITDGSGTYKYSTRLYYGGTGYIAWKENADNTALPQFNTAESVYSVSVRNGNVSERKTICSDIPLIYDIAIGETGAVAYIADSDGDYTTYESAIYVNGRSYDNKQMLSGLQFVNDRFAFTENGVLKTTDIYGSQPIAQYSGGGDNIKYLINGRRSAAVYEVQDGFTSNLYASYYEGGKWTNPVPITDFDEKMRSWDAYLNSDEEIEISAVLANIDVNGETFTQKVRLVNTEAAPIEDIAVVGVYADGAVVRGKDTKFIIGVENNTRNAVTTANVTLSSGGAVLYEGEQTVSLKAGEKGSITITTVIPDDFTAQNVTASVSVPNLAESNADNNRAIVSVGEAELTVKARADLTMNKGYAYVVIENASCEDVNDAVLTVTGENGEAIYTEAVGTIAAGDKKRVTIELDKKYYTFADKYDSFAITAKVTYSDKEERDTYRIRPESVMMLSLGANTAVLSPGDVFLINARFYPLNTSGDLYILSDDESIAKVGENRTVTAVDYGKTDISVMTPGALMASRMTLYVREKSAPVIVSAERRIEYVYDRVYVTVDTTGCLEEGETETMITAVYAEDGTLIGIDMHDVGASEFNGAVISKNQYEVRDKKPAYVKVMLWNSLKSMNPAALAAVKEVEYSE